VATFIVPAAADAFQLPPFIAAEEFAAGTGGKVSAADPRLDVLLKGASAAVRRYCGWHIAPVLQEELVLDGPGGPLVLLPTLHLVDVVSFADDTRDVQPADLEWSDRGMVRRRGSRWTSKFRGIRATVQHGFDEAPDVAQIVQQVVANAIASPMGATREQAGQVSISWASTGPNVSGGISLLERDLAVLDLYRLPKGA
jgi:hypothetical protein